jgi:hypothetical protein
MRLAALKQTCTRWTLAPAAAVITILLLVAEAPLLVRFAASEAALTAIAKSELAKGPMQPANRWTEPVLNARLFSVTVDQVTAQGEVFFRVPGTEFMRSCSGFCYCPKGIPNDPEGSFQKLDGPWYAWHTSW